MNIEISQFITKVFKFLEVDSSVVNSEFLKISKKNIPISSDGEEQEHHSRIGEKLAESIYDIDESPRNNANKT